MGEWEGEADRLALFDSVAPPLPLLVTDPEAVVDLLALALNDALGDTEGDLLALGDREELAGALNDLEAEKQVEMVGEGEDRVEVEAHALVVGQ